ncbi:MAG: hypothetical protein NUV75_07415, partial [Gallionella sp.]|nr:hypothetical protein [Gallionella sp.]
LIKGIDIGAADNNRPEKIKSQRTQIVKRVEIITEDLVQDALKPEQGLARNGLSVIGGGQGSPRINAVCNAFENNRLNSSAQSVTTQYNVRVAKR